MPSTGRTTGASTRPRSRAAAASRWPSRSSRSPSAVLVVNDRLGLVLIPFTIAPQELVALLVGGAVATVLGVLDDYYQLRARWQLLGQLLLATIAVVAGVTVTFINNPFGPGSIILTGPFAIGFTMLWVVGDDQQHQLHRRSRRALVRDRAHRGADAGPHLADRDHRAAVHRRAVLRARRVAARVPALELPPGVDLHRHQRRDVRGLHARRARDPRHREGGRRAARPRRPDHRHVLDHRAPPRDRELAVHPGPRPHPPPAAGPRACPTARPSS